MKVKGYSSTSLVIACTLYTLSHQLLVAPVFGTIKFYVQDLLIELFRVLCSY